ncbi:MAG: ABC-2 transporter permease [Clostridiales bacterium]|jgi:hypothetical protein|nr:ABC-2 transporter permease [Clostridiales bacterium]
MTSKLLYKELRLAAHPNLFVFTFLGFLVIVPAYPYSMVFIFGCIAICATFMYGRETNDIYYTTLLPVKKRDVVKAKFLLVLAVQMVQILVSLPFAVLRVFVLPDGNPAGIEANVAFYGFGFIIYGLFNLVFMTQFFKTAHKAGKAFLLALIPAIPVVFAMEALVHFPQFAWLDSITGEEMLRQLPILIAGIVTYPIFTLIAYRISLRRFDMVDL